MLTFSNSGHLSITDEPEIFITTLRQALSRRRRCEKQPAGDIGGKRQLEENGR
jgi:hypothetical protein